MKKREKRLKRIAAVVVAILMLNNTTNMPAFAISTTESTQTEIVTITSAPDIDLPENDELFGYFAEEKLYGYEMATFGTKAREGLSNEVEKAIYDALKAKIETVANNGGSTVFELDLEKINGLKTTWTKEELNVDNISNIDMVGEAFIAQFDFSNIVTALLNDCPFELYWYDKVTGAIESYSVGRTGTTVNHVATYTSATITNLTITFAVATDYKSVGNTVTTEVTKVTTAKNAAQTVIKENASKSDYEKLVAYRDYICGAVSYNNQAVSANYTGGYGNPWQLIYVFDGDDSTNVVCEGYSKAFQYLCDLAGVDCISVSGTMGGGTGAGGHMWNVVTLGGKNYLVDVTNSDTGTIGADGSLFLTGATYENNGYTIGSVTYTCSDLSLSEANYTPGAYYNVTVADTTNGTIIADKNTYATNDTVILTVTPDVGYELETLTVKQGNKEVTVTNNTFIMPEGDVTITATFKTVQHEHVWKYEANGNSITATCNGKGNCSVEDKTVTITLTVPAELNYDGTPKAVTVKQSPKGVFDDIGAVSYKKGDKVLNEVPVNVGSYTAYLTYGGVTVEKTFTINDVSAPTGEILIKSNSWKEFLNWSSFGLFYKDNVEVTVTADGTGSDVLKVEYLFSDKALEEDNIPEEDWTTLTAKEGKYSFSIQSQNKGAIYVRITDEYNNVAVINSDGIVVYTESAISPTAFEYVYKENTDRDVQITMNGNTFAKLTDANGNDISPENYTIDAKGKLVLKASYLNTLDKGIYTYMVYMNPQGEETTEVTLVHTFTVSVTARKLTVTKAAAKDKDYDGKNVVKITAVNLEGVSTGDTVSVNLTDVQGVVSSAKAGSYSSVTLPDLTLTGADANNYTLVQPEGAVATNVIIHKLNAVITADTSSCEKTFGEADFTLDVTDDNPEADVTYSSSNEDVITVSNGTVAIKGAGEATITISLGESTNYNAATDVSIVVKVKKADYPKNKPDSTISVSDACTKVSEVTALPEGWEWLNADKEKKLTAGKAVTATAQYTGEDKNNYNNLTVKISITRFECDHTEEPSTEEPSTEEPSTEEPSTKEPSTKEPSTKEPSTEEPSTKEPSTEEPSTEEPSTKEPSTEEPSTKEPSTKEPSTEEPSTEEPGTEEEETVEWKKDENGIFYEKEDGTRATGWYEMEQDVWYYFNENGYRETGWQKDRENWYYLNENGVMQTGWLKDGSTWYYLSGSGAMKTGWLKDGATWYYLSGSGAMKTGWLKDGATWYYLSRSGAMKTGWIKDGETWYYLSGSGAMKTGWIKDGENWYYLSGSGAMKTGWMKDGENWYYLSESGAMQTGWLQIGADWFYLNANGSMATSTYIGKWYVDKNGYYIPSKTK